MRAKMVLAVLSTLATSAAVAQGRPNGEKLIEHIPASFKLGWQSSNGATRTSEFVPRGETVKAWTELVTNQIFLGQQKRDTAAFLAQIGEKWLSSCPGSSPDAIRTGQSNGYVVSMLILRCEQSPRTGHAENTVFRAISGDDSLYVVQYAFRSTLDQEKMSKALAFMSGVTVCDAHSPEHPCP